MSEDDQQDPKATDRLANLSRLWRASNTARGGIQAARATKAGTMLVKGKVIFWVAVAVAALLALLLATMTLAALTGATSSAPASPSTFAELGLPDASDSNPYDARNLGIALGYGKALPFHTTVQITADGRSVIAPIYVRYSK